MDNEPGPFPKPKNPLNLRRMKATMQGPPRLPDRSKRLADRTQPLKYAFPAQAAADGDDEPKLAPKAMNLLDVRR